MIGAGKSRRTGADNCDLFLAWWSALDLYFPAVIPVGGQTFQVANGDRFIDVTAAAGVFTSMRANPAQYTGQRQILHNDFKGFFVLAHLYHVDIALHVQTARACQAAGGLVAFLNGESAGDSLGILLISRLFSAETFLIFIRKIDRTDLGAFAAAGALGKINIAGLFADPGLEPSRFTFQCEQFTLG